MLRSLYSYVRVLPAFRPSKVCCWKQLQLAPSAQALRHNCTLQRSRAATETCFTLGRAPSAAAMATRLEHCSLAPIETPFGFFRTSVDFQPAAAVHVLEQVLGCLSRPQGSVCWQVQTRSQRGSAATMYSCG